MPKRSIINADYFTYPHDKRLSLAVLYADYGNRSLIVTHVNHPQDRNCQDDPTIFCHWIECYGLDSLCINSRSEDSTAVLHEIGSWLETQADRELLEAEMQRKFAECVKFYAREN